MKQRYPSNKHTRTIVYLFILILVSFYQLEAIQPKNTQSVQSRAIGLSVQVVTFDSLKQLMKIHPTDKPLLVNFWATWCKPCVEELPLFVEAHSKNNAVDILLVSLDKPTKLKSTVLPFIAKNKITTNVVILEQPKNTSWIDEVHSQWSGTIPFTLLIKPNGQITYHEGIFTEKEFNTFITP